MVKSTVEWAREAYAAAVWRAAAQKLKSGKSMSTPEMLNKVIDAAKKHTKRPATSEGPDAVEVPFDVRGWRYSDLVSDLSRKELREAEREGGPLSPIMVIHSYRKSGSHLGSWNPNARNVIIWIPLVFYVHEFLSTLDQIAVIVRHELQHAGQYSLGELQKLHEPAGLPKHRQPGIDPGGLPAKELGQSEGEDARIEHGLRDIEFHTRLQDEVDSWAAHERAGHIPSDPEGKAAALKVWVGAGRASTASGLVKHPTEFFAVLKRGNKPKWKDAVGKFVREVYDDPLAFWKKVRSIRGNQIDDWLHRAQDDDDDEESMPTDTSGHPDPGAPIDARVARRFLSSSPNV
jgi:hypothetical protein